MEIVEWGVGPDDVPFDGVWAYVQSIPGWLTRAQARILFDCARDLPPHPLVVEIGSHQGRSTAVLACSRPDIRVVAIDAFVTRGKYPGHEARVALEHHLEHLRVSHRVTIIAARSQSVRPGWRDAIDLLWVDGKHDVMSALDDIRWAGNVSPGGKVLIHDAFSSVGVTLAVLAQLLLRRPRLRYETREGSLATFRTIEAGPRHAWRMAKEVPWWCRNLAVKVALRLRMRVIARALGHDGLDDPY